MCTPALRELKLIDPQRYINFYTDFPELVQGLPYIDKVCMTNSCPPEAISIGYEGAPHSREHLATLIGQSVGVRVNDVRPDCMVDEGLVTHFRNAWEQLPRPHVLVQRRSSSWTPNKNWPNHHWEELIPKLLQAVTVIEIGYASIHSTARVASNYLDFRGKTDLKALVACIAAADILVAPDSGPIHIAAAVRTPAIVILGGYILPENTTYLGNKILYTPIDCSPCWLRTPCPIDVECLKVIAPERVERAIEDVWGEIVNPASRRSC
jgi:ADP-heptose:LPS heptosyltransferase